MAGIDNFFSFSLDMITKLDLADAHFIGFSIGKREPGIIHLVVSMGLTIQEWKRWKEKYPTTHLTDSEIKEVDYHFNFSVR